MYKLKQINNGYEEYYYLKEDGTVFNAKTGRVLKPNEKHLFKLKQKEKGYKKISLKTLYKEVYGKPFCYDNIENLEDEEWKEIDNTFGQYLVSNMGRVKSLKNYNAIILKPYKNQYGYQRVDIIENGKRQSKLVHKLTAAAWLPMPEKIDYHLHHKDFDKTNNAANNLEFLPASDHVKKHAERNKKNGKNQQSAEPKGNNSSETTNRQNT